LLSRDLPWPRPATLQVGLKHCRIPCRVAAFVSTLPWELVSGLQSYNPACCVGTAILHAKHVDVRLESAPLSCQKLPELHIIACIQ
jgi:hypothetical protein